MIANALSHSSSVTINGGIVRITLLPMAVTNSFRSKHACFDRKLLVTAIGSSVIRTIPPLIVTEEECDKAFAIMKEAVESLA